MSKHADGGPAFPTPWAAGTATEGGMTLRDWFAGQALAAIISKNPPVLDPTGKDPDSIALFASRGAYKYADAMLKERNK